jgi:hypothetical protein
MEDLPPSTGRDSSREPSARRERERKLRIDEVKDPAAIGRPARGHQAIAGTLGTGGAQEILTLAAVEGHYPQDVIPTGSWLSPTVPFHKEKPLAIRAPGRTIELKIHSLHHEAPPGRRVHGHRPYPLIVLVNQNVGPGRPGPARERGETQPPGTGTGIPHHPGLSLLDEAELPPPTYIHFPKGDLLESQPTPGGGPTGRSVPPIPGQPHWLTLGKQPDPDVSLTHIGQLAEFSGIDSLPHPRAGTSFLGSRP